MVAVQMHERLDGSGFPKQQRAPQIHPLARIAGVADTYLSLVSPGPADPGVSPHRAIEQILQDTRQGLFDPGASRALLHAVSLFPLGSTVRLQDGRVGRVIRSNRENYARPVIQVVTRTESGQQSELIDLSQRPEVEIASAGPSLKTM
jgi:HD-GYP domain-containing protein (c-di-GMP phosphodiesterase class II)